MKILKPNTFTIPPKAFVRIPFEDSWAIEDEWGYRFYGLTSEEQCKQALAKQKAKTYYKENY